MTALAENPRVAYRAYLESPEWQERRRAALERAGHRCQLCNSTNRLNVHHRTYERVGNEDPGDLTVLCRPCHEKFHGLDGSKPRSVRRRTVSAPRPPVMPAADGFEPTPQELGRLRAIIDDMNPAKFYRPKDLGDLTGMTPERAQQTAAALVREGVLAIIPPQGKRKKQPRFRLPKNVARQRDAALKRQRGALRVGGRPEDPA